MVHQALCPPEVGDFRVTSRSNSGLAYGLGRLGLVIGLVSIWAAATNSGWVPSSVLPTPQDVGSAVVRIFEKSNMAKHVLTTISEASLAMLITVPIGVGVGMLLVESKAAGKALSPLIYFLFSVPKSLFLPTFILLFGISYSQKVMFGVFSSVFILIATVQAAAKGVPMDLLRMGRASGATRWQLYKSIYFPALLPPLLEGVRLAMIFNITGIVFAEMYAAREGVGHMVGYWGEYFMLPELMAGIFVAAAVSIVLNEALRALESKLGFWRQS